MTEARQRIERLLAQDIPFTSVASEVHRFLHGRKLLLYGAGDGFTTFSVFVLRRYGLTATAVLDRKFVQETILCGIPAYSPEAYVPTPEDLAEAVVIVTVGKEAYLDDIFRTLSTMGFHHVLRASDLYAYHLLCPPPELDAEGMAYFRNRREDILAALDLLRDPLSRDIYAACLETHLRRSVVPIPCSDLADQYFPRDVAMTKGYARFVSCGAYTGDTLRQLRERCGRVNAVVCFEPDARNFSVLTAYLEANRRNIADHVLAYPCGVYSREVQLSFAGGEASNSMIAEHGESMIPCVALDHALPGFSPTCITMDVEGAELEALRGAARILREDVPDVAVCVYHTPSHLWEIPLYLNRLGGGYRFFLRNYTGFISETVLYATV